MKLLPKQTELVMFNNGQVKFGGHKSNWFALVLNTEDGRNWIKNFRKKNPKLKVHARGRHSNRRLAYKLAGKNYNTAYEEHTVPKETAERFAIYIYKK